MPKREMNRLIRALRAMPEYATKAEMIGAVLAHFVDGIKRDLDGLESVIRPNDVGEASPTHLVTAHTVIELSRLRARLRPFNQAYQAKE